MSDFLRFDCEKDKDVAGNRLECCKVDCKKTYESHCQHCKRHTVKTDVFDLASGKVVTVEGMRGPRT